MVVVLLHVVVGKEQGDPAVTLEAAVEELPGALEGPQAAPQELGPALWTAAEAPVTDLWY